MSKLNHDIPADSPMDSINRSRRSIPPLLAALGMALALALLPSCADCPQTSAPGVIVRVVDEATGKPICDASVEVSVVRIYNETLSPSAPTGECDYTGVYDRNGLYEVYARKPGFAEAKQTLWVSSDSCHVLTQRVTLSMIKDP